MNEAETRAERIDPKLKACGWGVVEGSRILREYHITPGRIEGRGRRGTPEIADYVLDHHAVKTRNKEFTAMITTGNNTQVFLSRNNFRSTDPSAPAFLFFPGTLAEHP